MKPGFSGTSSPYSAARLGGNSYMDRYNENTSPLSRNVLGPTSRPSLGGNSTGYDPLVSGYGEDTNRSLSNNYSYESGPKENPFHRPSLFGNAGSNSFSLREELSVPVQMGKYGGYTSGNNYEHLIYKPGGTSIESLGLGLAPISEVPSKYSKNVYRTDNSDTASITSYIHKVDDLLEDSPYLRKDTDRSAVNPDDMFETRPIKDYSHLEYKRDNKQKNNDVPYSNGRDKAKYIYEK